MVDALSVVAGMSRPAIVYSSLTGWIFTRPFASVAHFQWMGAKWIGLNPRTKHNSIRDYYFKSIASPMPSVEGSQSKAWSAATPTEAISKLGILRYFLATGESTIDIEDDVYRPAPDRSGGTSGT